MASGQSLMRIAEEGFRMIDQAKAEKARCPHHHAQPTVHYPQPPSVTQVHRIVTPPPPPQIAYSQRQIQKPDTVYLATPQNHENIITHHNPQPGSAGHHLQPPSVTQVHGNVTPPPRITNSQRQFRQPTTVYQQARPQNLENITNPYNPPRGSAGHKRVIPAPVTTRDQASAGVIDSNEAARKYGGMVVTDYYPNGKVTMQRINKAY